MAWIPVNETITATENEKYLLDTSQGEFSIILPQLPTIGTSVILADAVDVSVNKVSVLAQSQFPFEGGGTFFILDIAKSQHEFVFNGLNWVIYNLSRQGRKITNLPEQPFSQISNDDLIPYVNKTGNTSESTAISFVNLKQSITADVFTSADDIIDAINSSGANPTLNVKTFDGQPSSFYRNYNNLTNKPAIPTLVSQLSNNLGYISNLTTFTSDNLTEGQTNKYLTETNFNALFEPAFSEAYRIFSGDFPEQSTRNSIDNIAASPLTTSASTSFINISDPANIEVFFVGKKIRIYGGTINPVISIPTPAMGGATKRGFSSVVCGNSVRYKIIQFNFLSGEYSPTSNESNAITGIDLNAFNDVNNISVTFSRTNTEYGVLIYRSVGSASFVLIDVLGPRQLGSSVQNAEYVDYGKFNAVPWSKKNVNAGNVYDTNTGLVHFPAFVSSINSASRGWVSANVIAVDTAARRIRIDAELYFNSNITISEDDTEQVQNAINQRRNIGVSSLTLNDRRYIVSGLNIPSNFSLFGRGQGTSLRKISWDFSPSNKIITPSGISGENIVLSNFTIDGNMQNQWLKSETGDFYTNYAVDLKEAGVGNTIDRIRISNIVGGGIASPRGSKTLIDRSRVEDSGMTDFFDYSPLIADEGAEVVITNNIFKNFTSAIDLSLSDNGVFTSNIVENVGSGVITYGSKFLISAPNIIRGPAGEFIPGPDVINSVYDSVNINLEPDTNYVSDVYKYQENGINFDITANRSELNFRMDKLRLVNNAEELHGEVLIVDGLETRKPIQRVLDVGLNPVQGEFKFAINAADVNTILTDFSVTALRETEPNNIGLVYSANLTEYVPSGNIIGTPVASTNTYQVTVTNFKNLFVGAKVRMLGHGGTPNLNTLVGTVTTINTTNANPTPPAVPEIVVTISYEENISVVGTGGQITVENTFILAKGRVF
jgi:hypothetical protein